mgnify:CR=1 FL=1
MPKRTDIKSVLIIGAGPIVIGQACEFDYSGAQACKALREEGYKVILVNSNPATIMTDPQTADVTYIEPITKEVVERIIAKERPDAILPTMGGQTALNCAMELAKSGVLEKYNIELIGASPEAIEKAEDRLKFKEAMDKIGLSSARSGIAYSLDDALKVQAKIGFPAIIRPSFTLGGSGGGIAYNMEEFIQICTRGLELSPTHELLIEESLLGWKEYEMEVVRDSKDNCIIVCSIENFDPMGVHTGDSITVAPAQTLTDKEYQIMRDASIAILREIGVDTGGSNVQFAVNPKDGRLVVIEMNPRVSRSSALASKATGFPIAKVAAKLAVGYTLDELKNEITGGRTPASFEPTIDYVVVKTPRFAFEKFPKADKRLTTQMKSVGEVMAIGRTFQEALQKALRGLETGKDGLNEISTDRATIHHEISEPGPDRLWYLADAFRLGYTVKEAHRATRIDPWFLVQVKELVDIENRLKEYSLPELSKEEMLFLKKKGFSDRRIAKLLKVKEDQVRARRHELGIRPVYKRVDTCAGEFPTDTAYMYSTYEEESEVNPSDRRKIMILGGGPNRIGQGIEFDYCCVHAAIALKELGFETIIVNCNPETVSTDYDTSDKLYFEPLTLEDVLSIYHKEKPLGVIAQFGGQTPLNLAADLKKYGVNILGTTPETIDMAEDRDLFRAMMDKLQIPMPESGMAVTVEDALEIANKIGYPVMVRPSYVLGGRGMEVVHDDEAMTFYMRAAVGVTPDRPILIDRFLHHATECEADAISDGENVFVPAVMEHIELAGIHSGDSACILPSRNLTKDQVETIRDYTSRIAKEMHVVGLMNMQYAIEDGEVYVLEANPRASRTVPLVSKVCNIKMVKLATDIMTSYLTGRPSPVPALKEKKIPHYGVKMPVFPFKMFPEVDPVLGPEMRSTGEVLGMSTSVGEAIYKAQEATQTRLPSSGTVLLSVNDKDKIELIEVARGFYECGFTLMGTGRTCDVMVAAGLPAEKVCKINEGRPNILDKITNGEVAIIINTPNDKKGRGDDSYIRKAAVKAKIPYFTNMAAAKATVQALRSIKKNGHLEVKSLQEFHSEIQ